MAVYVAVALLWLIPDPRVERTLAGAEAQTEARADPRAEAAAGPAPPEQDRRDSPG